MDKFNIAIIKKSYILKMINWKYLIGNFCDYYFYD